MTLIKSKTKLKSVRLSADLVEKLEEMAKEQNRNFTNMVETLLKKASCSI